MISSIKRVIQIVSEEMHVSVNDILGPSRKREVSLARHISMWACKNYTRSSLETIAITHKRKNHGSVINAKQNVENLRKVYPHVNELLTRVVEQINRKHDHEEIVKDSSSLGKV